MTQNLENGDFAIEACVFCDAPFEDKQQIGKECECLEDDGGCGTIFKLLIVKRKINK